MDKQKRPWKLLMTGLLAGVLVLGTLAVTQPAIAAAPLKWAKIWKKEIKPRADKRYYTKKKSNARYAAKPTVIRGNFAHTTQADSAGDFVASAISFGVTLPAGPTTHYIERFAAVPTGCGGTLAAPTADPGHLCVFEGFDLNVGAGQLTNGSGSGAVGTTGALVFSYSSAAGQALAYGTWALGTGPDAVWARVSPQRAAGQPAGKQ